MKLSDYIRAARQHWIVILAVASLVLGATAYVTFTASPLYRASSAIYVSPQGNTAAELGQGSNFIEGQMTSYTELASTSAVLEPVIAELGLTSSAQQLSRSVKAVAGTGSTIVRITATSTDPNLAAEMANATADSLSVAIADLAPTRLEGGATVIVANVQEASTPTAPFSPNAERNLVAALVAGLLLGYLLALVLALRDTRIRSAEQVRALTKVPVVAELPPVPTDPSAGAQGSHYGEEVRRLRANLEFAHTGEQPLEVVVTSALPDQGASTTALHLAQACAADGQRVLLIDGDLRRPKLHTLLGLDPSIGLSTVLAGDIDLLGAVQSVGREGNLRVITSGRLPTNPTAMLSSAAMSELLIRCRRDYDIVIVDAPPILPVIDPLVLARKASGLVLVAAVGQLRSDDFTEALDAARDSGAAILGVVMTGTPKSGTTSYARLTPGPKASGVPSAGAGDRAVEVKRHRATVSRRTA